MEKSQERLRILSILNTYRVTDSTEFSFYRLKKMLKVAGLYYADKFILMFTETSAIIKSGTKYRFNTKPINYVVLNNVITKYQSKLSKYYERTK